MGVGYEGAYNFEEGVVNVGPVEEVFRDSVRGHCVFR